MGHWLQETGRTGERGAGAGGVEKKKKGGGARGGEVGGVRSNVSKSIEIGNEAAVIKETGANSCQQIRKGNGGGRHDEGMG